MQQWVRLSLGRFFFNAIALVIGSLVMWHAHADDSDHPLLSRIPGFEIQTKEVQPLGAVTLSNVVGKLPKGEPTSFEGKITTIEYFTVQPLTQYLIYKTYLTAVQKAGGKQLNFEFDPSDEITHSTGSHVFTLPTTPTPTTVLLDDPSGHRYTLTFIEAVEQIPEVSVGKLASDIENIGFATLYINFDTNKADLKQDGLDAVKNIATLLRQNPSLKLSIEGHTDNLGSPSANKTLSLSRANAVMKAVVASGISASRLQAKGFGQEVPIADNRSDDGRAKNRRVELVRIK